MKGGGRLTQAALDQLFGDVEHYRMCLFRPRGWERAALEGRVASGELVRPCAGMFARREYWDRLRARDRALHVAKTAGVVRPSWVFTHATAALAHNLDVPFELASPIHYATSRSGGGRSRTGFVHHRYDDIEFVKVDDVRVTPVARTIVDCARTYSFGCALAIADSALHQQQVTREELARCLDAMPGRHGMRVARRVVELADPRPESGGESRVRALMLDLGLPMPELQVPVPDPECPAVVYRVDFLFRPERLSPVAFELDGLEKYENLAMTRGKSAVQVMAEERQREAAITACGIRVARMGFRQAMDPSFLLRRLAAYGVVPR